MGIRTTLYTIGGKLLQPFINPELCPDDLTQLEIDTDKPLVYVLENRGWTDLHVLTKICKDHNLPSPLSSIASPVFNKWQSVYTIAPNQPFKAWLLNQPKRSEKIRGMLQTLKDYPEQDIQFVPVSLFWGRPVSKQKHWLQILFADSWVIAGRTRKAFTILLNGRQTLITLSNAIKFSDFVHTENDDNEVMDNLQSALATRLVEMRTATLGPDVSHRRTLVRKLLSGKALRNEIQNHKDSNNLNDFKAALVARKYLYEIVADSTNITISLLQRGLTRFWNKFYSGIIVNESHQLSELALTHSLVYVPCHRSHVDYLLLSYVIHGKGLAIPYVAAGKNLNMPLIGPVLRGAGAFFIRRSFKGNALYSTALFEYLALLVSTGMPIEYFIEGGRSRTGRLLKAKPGMLAMTVRAYLKYRKRPIAFIPVYIGYEKMIEGGSYLSELAGENKKSETLLNSIRSIFRIRGEFGKVYANFAEAILLDDVLDATNNSWSTLNYDDNERPLWLNNTVSTLSHNIQTQINCTSSVNAINFIATILLTSYNHHMDEYELATIIDNYSALLTSISYTTNTSITTQTGLEQIHHAEKLRLVKRKRHKLGDIIYVDESSAKLLPYYRNNVLHLFVIPSVIACCFNTVRTTGKEKIKKLVSLVYPYLKAELFIHWDENELDSTIDHALNMMVAQDLLIRNDALDVYTKPGSGSIQFIQLETLGKILSPLLELYYLTIAIISKKAESRLTLAEINDICFLEAQRVSLIHELNPPDFADKQLISNFVNLIIDNNYLKINSANQIEVEDAFIKADKEARLLISTHMRSNILQLIKNRGGL